MLVCSVELADSMVCSGVLAERLTVTLPEPRPSLQLFAGIKKPLH